MSQTPSHPAQTTRTDTSICSHLSALLASPSTSHTDVQSDNPSNGHAASTSTAGDLTRREAIERRYTQAVRWGAVQEGAKRRKCSPPKCHSCSKTIARPWSCLTCDHIVCSPIISSTCFTSHKAKSPSCTFAVDPVTGSIFCDDCNDATYPDSFDALLQKTRIQVEEENDFSRVISGGKGKKRAEWNEWKPPTNLPSPIKTSCRGLRPLLNLSQTCFLSAILQALIHNPLLKAYFLSEKHNRHVCANSAKSRGLMVGKPFLGTPEGSGNGSGNGNGNGNGNVTPGGGDRDTGCMCCEMDRAFEEFHGDDKSPFGPITMLYAMWHASAELEGHGQQDAHSFFLAALDQLHAHSKGQLSSCNCIAHTTFSGSLLSAVTCSKCNTTSSTIDPILDIQLDFPTTASSQSASQPVPSSASSTTSTSSNTTLNQSNSQTNNQGSTHGSVNGNGNKDGGETLTLAGMLRRYCAEERVGDIGKGYDCASCGGGPGVGGMRRLMIKKLPPVLSFQLKRFAHSATSTKVETSVKFPSQLDMRPYTESGITTTDNLHDPLPASMYIYDLFAVVTHEGKLDNGHYWADVLTTTTPGGGGEWWHCDDDKVTPTTLGKVLGQRAYMLFYVKRSLGFGEGFEV